MFAFDLDSYSQTRQLVDKQVENFSKQVKKYLEKIAKVCRTITRNDLDKVVFNAESYE